MFLSHKITFLRKSYQKYTEAYRSGHNGAVLKTVWVKAHGGSNPSASAIKNGTLKAGVNREFMNKRFSGLLNRLFFAPPVMLRLDPARSTGLLLRSYK